MDKLRLGVSAPREIAVGRTWSSRVNTHGGNVIQGDVHAHRDFNNITIVKNEVGRSLGRFSDSERGEILRWISKIPYPKHHMNEFSKVLDGTGQWLLRGEAFNAWLQSSETSTLWLHGIPGSGKTALTSIVVDHILKRQKQLTALSTHLAFFYCVDPEDRATTETIMRCLLRQVASTESATQISPAVLKTISDRQQNGFTEEDEPLTIAECVDLISSIARDRECTYIVIDALDECGDEERHGIFDALDSIAMRSEKPIKIFLSSRELKDIVHRLRQTPNIYIRADDNIDDIRYYVSNGVDHAIREGRLCEEVSHELRQDIIQALSLKAQGMFQWVKLSLQRLRSHDLVLEEDIREELGRLPLKLGETYKPIYAQILQSAPKSRALAVRVLHWLLCCNRSLSTKELIAAVSVSANGKHMKMKIEDIVNVSHTLVVVDRELDRFRLAHLSVKEFLEQEPDFSEAVQNTIVAERCIVACLKDDTVLKEVWDANDILYHYAMFYWGPHCSSSDRGRTTGGPDGSLQGNYLPQLFRRFLLSEGAGSPQFRRTIIDAYKEQESVEFKDMASLELYFSVCGAKLQSCVWAPGNETPNFAACAWDFREVLADRGRTQPADLQMQNIEGKTCLQIAVSHGSHELVQLLIDRKADVNGGSGKLAIHLAVERGSLNLLNNLVEAEADFEAREPEGKTALMVAIKCLQPQLVERLLELGAKVDVSDNTGQNPFHLAVKSNTYSSMSFLLNHSTPGNAYDQDGFTVLHLAVKFGREHILGRLLKLPDTDINYHSKHSQTALGLAVLAKNDSLVSVLLERPGINQKISSNGWTPLFLAALHGYDHLTALLLKHQPMDYTELAMQICVEQSGSYHHGPIAQFWSNSELADLSTKLGTGGVVEDNLDSEFLTSAILGSRVPLKGVLSCGPIEKTSTSDRPHQNKLIQAVSSKDFDLASRLIAKALGGSAVAENSLIRLMTGRPVEDPNERDQFGRTPLWWAVSTNNFSLASRLINSKLVDPNMPDKIWGVPPLSVAILGGREMIAKLLIARQDVDVNLQDHEWGQTPLTHASRLGRYACVELLLKRSDIAPYLCDGRWRRSPLSWAAGEGHLAITKRLRKFPNSCLNHTDLEGRSALTHAILAGHLLVAKDLLADSHIDTTLRDKKGRNALWIAASKGYCELFLPLINAGGNENMLPDRKGQTLIGVAAMNGHTTTVREIIRIGLDVGFGIQQVDSNGRTPLALAAMNGHVDVVAVLLKANQSLLRAADFDGRDPLSLAAQNGHLAVVKSLLLSISALEPKGYGITGSKDRSKRSPLSWAAEYGHFHVVHALRAAEPCLTSLFDVNGRCALSWAASGGHLPMVRYLLSCSEVRKVLRDLQDCNRRSPCHWAMEFGHYKVAELIATTELEDRLGTSLKNPSPILIWPERLIRDRCKTMINYKQTQTGKPMISEAVEEGQMRALSHALGNTNFDVNDLDKAGHPPIWYAVQNDNKLAAMRFIASRRLDEDGRQLLLKERPEWVLEEQLLRTCFPTLHPATPFQIHRSEIINKVQWSEKERRALRGFVKVMSASLLSASCKNNPYLA